MLFIAILTAVLALVVLSDALLVVLLLFNFKPIAAKETVEGHPVAVLVAARNEAEHLSACLEGLVAQDYPKDKLEVWVGNDGSSDGTLEIAKAFALQHDFIKVLDIRSNLPDLKGKANVLAQLAQQASGDFYFITDADIRLPSSWVKTMLAQLTPEVGIVTGVTVIQGAAFQCLEWLVTMGMIKVGTDAGLGTTAMGNNMLVTRAAYEEVGGYEQLPFSITEDLALSQAILRAGYKAKHILHPDVLGLSAPTYSFTGLMQQRKRWMTGATGLPLPLVIFLFTKIFSLPLLIVLALFQPELALSLLLLRTGWQLALIYLLKGKLNVTQGIHVGHVLCYGLYEATLSALAGCFFFLPVKVRWKGRTY